MSAERWKELLRNHIGYLAVAAVSLSYLATAFVTIGETGKTPARIVADGAVAFLLGILINRLFDAQGMMNGERDERVIAAIALHRETAERLSPDPDDMDEWCEGKNAEALKRVRRRYLAEHGMRYADCFEADGTPRRLLWVKCKRWSDRAEEVRRHRICRHAVRLKITRLSSALLLGDSGHGEDPYFMGRSKSEYARQSSRKDVLTKLLTALLFGYYGVSLIRDPNAAALIWTVLQVSFFVGMGIFKMQSSYLFVTDEYRGRLTKKVGLLRLYETERKKEDGRDGCYEYGRTENEDGRNADGQDRSAVELHQEEAGDGRTL